MNDQPGPKTARSNAFERILGGVIGAIGEGPAERVDLCYLEYIAQWVLDTYEMPQTTTKSPAERARNVLENAGITPSLTAPLDSPENYEARALAHLNKALEMREEAAASDENALAYLLHIGWTTDPAHKVNSYERNLYEKSMEFVANQIMDKEVSDALGKVAAGNIRILNHGAPEPDHTTKWATTEGINVEHTGTSWAFTTSSGHTVDNYLTWSMIPAFRFPLTEVRQPDSRRVKRTLQSAGDLTIDDLKTEWRDANGLWWTFRNGWVYRERPYGEGHRSTPTNFPWTEVIH